MKAPTCSICGGPIEPVGDWIHGHSAVPVTDGRCCGKCAAATVLSARIIEMRRRFHKQTFRLASAPMLSAPGIIRWAIAGFKSDRSNMLNVIVSGWGVPESAAHALLSGAAPYRLEGDVVVFEVPRE